MCVSVCKFSSEDSRNFLHPTVFAVSHTSGQIQHKYVIIVLLEDRKIRVIKSV